jgi:hypothetical protein
MHGANQRPEAVAKRIRDKMAGFAGVLCVLAQHHAPPHFAV